MKSFLPLVLALAWLSSAGAAEPKPIAATVGKEFEIRLESDSSTGCQWLLAKPLDDKLLKQTGKTYERPRAPRSTVGFEVLTYKPLAKGKTTISLKFDRLWEKARAPLHVTNVVVVISGPD